MRNTLLMIEVVFLVATKLRIRVQPCAGQALAPLRHFGLPPPMWDTNQSNRHVVSYQRS